MASCPSCGAEGISLDTRCPRCGADPAEPAIDLAPAGGNVPDLELNIPARPPPKARAPVKQQEEELSLELAVDPRELLAQASAPSPPAMPQAPAPPATSGSGQWRAQNAPAAPLARAKSSGPPPAIGDLAFDARLLADYGDAPKNALLTPLYAWRVLKRQREVRAALVGRREEAARAATEAEDAMVALTERVRPLAEKHKAYAESLEQLQRAEDMLRSRDRVLAAEQDAQKARLGAVDANLSKLESELAAAQSEERILAGQVAEAQSALAREEAKLKRAEIELRTAQQRESGGAATR